MGVRAAAPELGRGRRSRARSSFLLRVPAHAFDRPPGAWETRRHVAVGQRLVRDAPAADGNAASRRPYEPPPVAVVRMLARRSRSA
jgi:hypothetical protein